MTTATSPHVRVLLSQLARPIPYRWVTRLVDRGIGRSDGRAGLAHEVEEGAQPSASLRRLDADLTERCELERLAATRMAAPLLDLRRQNRKEIEALTDEGDELRLYLETVSGMPAADLNRVGASEAHLPEVQVKARREREAAARLAPLRARLGHTGDRVRALKIELAEIDGKLTTLFEGMQARTWALAEYYERRASNQSRSYLLRTPAEQGLGHPLNTRTKLTAPSWTSGANPWLPADPITTH